MSKTKLSDICVIAILIACNLWICNVNGQQNGDCDTVDFIISFVVFDIQPGKHQENEIQMEKTKGVVSHTEIPYNAVKYLSFNYIADDSKVHVTTTDEFLNYELDQTHKELIATVRLLCDNDEEIDMIVTFEFQDVNDFAPEFSQSSYEIEIPLPLPSDIDIFLLISDRISAHDNDLQNNDITFTSDITDQPFRVETSREGNEFFAKIFTTERILTIMNGIEFKIIATDSGTEEQKSTAANVKIIPESDYEGLTEIPIFIKPVYIGELDFRKTVFPLTIETISIEEQSYNRSLAFEADEFDGQYFMLHQHNFFNAIECELQSHVVKDDFNGRSQLAFTVTATLQNGIQGNTAVIVNVLESVSLFDNVLYTGTIKSDMSIEHDPIKLNDVSYRSDVEYLIKDDVLGWFKITPVPNQNEVQLELIRPLTYLDIMGKTLVSFTIIVVSADNTLIEGESQVILGIEKLNRRGFQENFYLGTISADLDITGLDELKPTGTTIGNVEYVLSNYNNWFVAVKFTDGIQIKKKELEFADIADKSSLQFTVTANDEGGTIWTTVVIIEVEREEPVLPNFEKQTYTGYLKLPLSSDSFQLEHILLNPHPGVVVFALSGDDAHLIKIESEIENGIVLGLENSVTGDNISEKSVLSVIVTAKVTNNVIGSTLVLIHVNEEVIGVSCNPDDQLGLIIGIVVIASLLAVEISYIFVIWWRWIRPDRQIQSELNGAL